MPLPPKFSYMRRTRGILKYLLHSYIPLFSGSFTYWGTRVYFPPAAEVFRMACEQGIYEADNMRVMLACSEANTYVFDIGANLGLMSIPILKHCPSCRVVAFEPSPNTVPFLTKTVQQSAYSARWSLVPKAIGALSGRTEFTIGTQAQGLLDGIRHTQRAAASDVVTVDITSIDIEWNQLGRPPVSLIKCDIEGAELDALKGAQECINATCPAILIEWNATNLAAYDCPPHSLWKFAQDSAYQVLAVPSLTHVNSPIEFTLHMQRTENFLLLPIQSTRRL
jgi:FkbM family methyltransferase